MYLITIVNKETQEKVLVYAEDQMQFRFVFDYVSRSDDYDIEIMEKKTVLFGIEGLKDFLGVAQK